MTPKVIENNNGATKTNSAAAAPPLLPHKDRKSAHLCSFNDFKWNAPH